MPNFARKPDAPRKLGPRQRISLLLGLCVLAGMALLAALWSRVPLHDWIAPGPWLALLRPWAESPAAPAYALAAYVLGGLLVVPILGLFVLSFLLFGPLPGFCYALSGALLSAAVVHGAGGILGRDAVAGLLAGSSLEDLRARLARRGILTMAVVRVLPLAPFSVVNLVAGASGIPRGDFLLGSALGLLPSILAMGLLGDRIEALLGDPGVRTALLFLGSCVLLTAAAVGLRRWLADRER